MEPQREGSVTRERIVRDSLHSCTAPCSEGKSSKKHRSDATQRCDCDVVSFYNSGYSCAKRAAAYATKAPRHKLVQQHCSSRPLTPRCAAATARPGPAPPITTTRNTRSRCARGRGRTAPGWGVVSRRPAVVRRLHAVEATRVHQTGSWLVSFSILRRFWGRRRAWAAALFEPGARRGVPGERRRATGGRRLRSGRRRREPVALSADGGGDPIGKKRWKLAARLRRVSGAAAGVVRAEPPRCPGDR